MRIWGLGEAREYNRAVSEFRAAMRRALLQVTNEFGQFKYRTTYNGNRLELNGEGNITLEKLMILTENETPEEIRATIKLFDGLQGTELNNKIEKMTNDANERKMNKLIEGEGSSGEKTTKGRNR